ncbi:MAG: hypothetical protein FWC69_01910, partial [Defluviitaleaceae bacterium]|nr:hypothetical protein [Defluviitaleaceae bacterium]
GMIEGNKEQQTQATSHNKQSYLAQKEEQARARQLKAKIERLEKAIEEAEEAIAKQDEVLAKPDVATNHVRAAEEHKIKVELEAKLEGLLAEWEEANS